MRRPAWFSLLVIIPSLLLIWAVWDGRIPLGVSGEWTWQWVQPVLPLGLLLALPELTACGYMVFVGLGSRRMERCRRAELWGWLAGLVVAGFLWLGVVQEAAPPGYQLSKAAWVLYYPGPSGYFTQARHQAQDLHRFLADYESRMSEGDVLHIGTHPPGLVVCYRGLIALCERSPALVGFLLRTQPESVRHSFDLIEENNRRGATPLTRIDRAVLWFAALLVQFVAAATVLPLYGLLRRYLPSRTSWLAASFWPATPALALFLPKSDAMYACLGALFLLLWLEGRCRRSGTLCCLAGLILWIGMGLSLALIPVACLAGFITLWEFWFFERQAGGSDAGPAASGANAGRQLSVSVFWGALGFLIPCAATWLATGMNLFAVWAWNLHNHAAFYASYPRTYWKWLLVNPVELAVAGGLPVAILAVWSCCREVRCGRSRLAGACWGSAAVFAALLVSGKNMGEAARLWIVIMPWLILLAAPLLERDASLGDEKSERNSLIKWGVVLGCQFVLTAVLVTRIVGFFVPT